MTILKILFLIMNVCRFICDCGAYRSQKRVPKLQLQLIMPDVVA